MYGIYVYVCVAKAVFKTDIISRKKTDKNQLLWVHKIKYKYNLW
jgi:hypothetical protein